MVAKVPTSLKILRGNPGKRALPRNEPEPGPVETLEPPSWLSPEARQAWRILRESLAAVGLLRTIDVQVFAALCDAIGDLERYALALQAQGGDGTIVTASGTVVQSPLVGMKRRARADVQRLAAAFGMTPVSRSGMQILLSPTVTRQANAAPSDTDHYFTKD